MTTRDGHTRCSSCKQRVPTKGMYYAKSRWYCSPECLDSAAPVKAAPKIKEQTRNIVIQKRSSAPSIPPLAVVQTGDWREWPLAERVQHVLDYGSMVLGGE